MHIKGCYGLNSVLPKDNEVLTPNTPKWILTWRAFIDVINLRTQEWYYPGLSRYSLNPMTNIHIRDTQGYTERTSHAKMEAEISYSDPFQKIIRVIRS